MDDAAHVVPGAVNRAVNHVARDVEPVVGVRLPDDVAVDGEGNRADVIGMVMVVPASEKDAICKTLTGLGEQVYVIGQVVERTHGAAVQLI